MAEVTEPYNTAKRDFLVKIQESSQKKWEEAKLFEVDAPSEGETVEKFFGNFPYPYMNGLLHLGHAFSLSKLEFASAYHRLSGKRVLFPQAFHLTGMPIKACADKLKGEIERAQAPEEAKPVVAVVAKAPTERDDPSKFTGKKSKAAAKTGPGNTQWEIMRMSGIPEEDIPKFADAKHWLQYFPPLAVRDIKAMGCGVDWRRSFVTTDLNKYYDSFIQWQFWTLYSKGKIVKDKRYSVYSPKDGQPCADHDRATGEGVGPQEYTLVKMKVLELRGILAALEGQGDVFLMAATLRPETMYGQTNAWVRPSDPKNPDSEVGKYAAFRAKNGEIFVLTARAARNMCFQDLTPENGVAEKLLDLTGEDLLGLPLRSPRATHERIYVLPLLTIKMDKGTGVVTSVPSDSPDDYAALQDLVKKPKLRELYSITDEMVLPYQVIPIIDIPGLGDLAAVKLCTDLKVQSQNDTEKLAKAKAECYRRGFDSGVMLVGTYAGKPVKEAKDLEKADLIRAGDAVPYAEPENPVRSRSDDDCVVALTDQWYIIYGEEEWRAAAQSCLEQMHWYDASGPSGDSITKGQFEHTLGWLNQWACSRSFGLGTLLPWDPEYLIESLSDSTIYMAYYTVAHLLHEGDMYAVRSGPVDVRDLTNEVWNYIFLGGELPRDTPIPRDLLARARREFEFWYPFDLRVSGKDLIQNHLTFALYTHVALWGPDKWPRSFRCNGHLQLNNAKMSKSTGNFKTMEQAILEYGADAMRIGLANAGDTMDDANFEHDTANQAILKLYRQVEWAEEVLAATQGMRDGPPATFWDRVFENEINAAVHRTKAAYDDMNFRDVVLAGWYALSNARDAYLVACAVEGLNRELILRFVEVAALLVAPIAPHTSEYIWGDVLKREGLILTAGWPAAPQPDFVLQEAYRYVEKMKKPIKDGFEKAAGGSAGKKGQPAVPASPVAHAHIHVVDRFGGWKARALQVLAGLYDASLPDCFPAKPNETVLSAVAGEPELTALPPKQLRPTVFPFVAYKTKQAKEGGKEVLSVKLPFDEAQVLEASTGYILRALQELKGLQSITIHKLAFDELATAGDERVRAALPGEPVIVFTA
uniref:leucine--tRNA ligase n=2 Tax=Auxenochlorella protothecoides TaxID=3075 RepID=A0A1D2A3Q3_AUXPR